jgi:hyperosmotically inducible protein
MAQTTERAISDSVITAKVKSELLADSVGKGLDVSVTTNHGAVTLRGNLANPDAINRQGYCRESCRRRVLTPRLSSSGG